MNTSTKQRVIAELLRAGRPDLANKVSVLSAKPKKKSFKEDPESKFYREDAEREYKFALAGLTQAMTDTAKLVSKQIKGKVQKVTHVKDNNLYTVGVGDFEGEPDLTIVVQGPVFSVAFLGYVLFQGQHLIATGIYEGTPEASNNIERDSEQEPDPRALAKWIVDVIKDSEAQGGKIPGVRDGSGPPGGGPGLRQRMGEECPFTESAAEEFPPGVADELAQRMKKHWRTSTYNPKTGTGLIKTGSWDINLQQSGNEEKVWIDVKPTTRFRFFSADDAVKFIDALEKASKLSD